MYAAELFAADAKCSDAKLALAVDLVRHGFNPGKSEASDFSHDISAGNNRRPGFHDSYCFVNRHGFSSFRDLARCLRYPPSKRNRSNKVSAADFLQREIAAFFQPPFVNSEVFGGLLKPYKFYAAELVCDSF